MIKISFIELIIRIIPEGVITIGACYILSKTKFQLNRYLLSSVLLALTIYIVRCLPINLGINTMLSLAVMISINININKISIIKSISVSISTIILLAVCELINILMIKYLFKADLTKVFSDPISKIIYGIPSLLLFILLIIIINVVLKKKK